MPKSSQASDLWRPMILHILSHITGRSREAQNIPIQLISTDHRLISCRIVSRQSIVIRFRPSAVLLCLVLRSWITLRVIVSYMKTMVALPCCIINFMEMLALFCLRGCRVVFRHEAASAFWERQACPNGVAYTGSNFYAKPATVWFPRRRTAFNCPPGLSSPIRIQGFTPQSNCDVRCAR